MAAEKTPTAVGPLEGIKVLDFTQVMLGPAATQMLGDFGAEVVKVERPGGDLSRWSVDDPEDLDNPVFCSLNRNKRSITLDLRHERARKVVLRLACWADVLVENFRPGVMERMGLGYDSVSRLNPGLIYASGSGFGSSGPRAHKGGQDVLAQALSGVMARRSEAGQPLSVYPTALADYTAAVHLAQAILLALLARSRSGLGQRVEVCLHDAMLAMQTQEAAARLMRDEELNWGAMPLTAVFETADLPLVVVGAFRPDPLGDLCRALRIDDLSDDPRFSSREAMKAHTGELRQLLQEVMRTEARSHWLELLEAADFLCAPVQDLTEALADPQTQHNEMIWRAGSLQVIGSPMHLGTTPAALRRGPPHLGEQTDEVLDEIGLGPEAIAELRHAGALG
ncbi:MAG: CaiB/BaiF CoA transferase family protein [Acidimicrobiales bacterium]